MKSTHEVDIESSNAHGVWTSSRRVNIRLDRIFRTGEPVIFFFSVVERSVLTCLSIQRISGDNVWQSRRFCGVAVMTSEVDYMRTDDFWAEDRWEGYTCHKFRGFLMLMQFSEDSASVGSLPQ
jgi:YTH domain-containing family protein